MENSQLVAKLFRAKKKRSSASWNLLADGCAAATEIGACKREPPKRNLLEFRFLCEWTPCSRFFVEKIAGDRGSTLHMYGLFVSRCQVLRGELNLREKKEIGEGEAREESTEYRIIVVDLWGFRYDYRQSGRPRVITKYLKRGVCADPCAACGACAGPRSSPNQRVSGINPRDDIQ
ncbi:hypothetical protein K0M31_013195 [Melipona bicolor]|uniref:Uncharacterized protein n=1 Tax=Melipona bicolor TaxID=60889 RepID=A0AA40KGR3_9HYME|nr:hypothetical protein K0M31_013195 [Melipona bicolor]